MRSDVAALSPPVQVTAAAPVRGSLRVLLLGVRDPIHVLGMGFLPPNHSQLLSQGVLGCRMPGSPPAVVVRSLSWCSWCEPPDGAGPCPCHPLCSRAAFASINAVFAGTVLAVPPYLVPTPSLEPACPGSPEPPTSPGRSGPSPPLLQHPQARESVGARDYPGFPLGTALGGVWSICSPARASPASAGSRDIPWAGPGRLAVPCPARDSLWALGSNAGLNAAAPEGRGLLRSLIPAYFSEV